MLKRIEDITVISADDFLAYEGDMIFVDTECPFQSQPIAQAFVSISDAEDELPHIWQEISIFPEDFFMTYEDGVIHTFISLEFKDQYLFIKVIAIGEPNETKMLRIR
jgi:hypothetical protein